MRALRHIAGVLLFGLSFLTLPASATSFSTDSSDLWWNATESGWGMQLVQRGSTIFATLFIYGPNGAPTWYVATMVPTGTTYQWSGDLYATTGPWFGTFPFNPANTTATKVGTMTWMLNSVEQGSLTYVVNGVAVVKEVARQTLVFDDFSGTFKGALHRTTTECSNPLNNGTFEFFVEIVVSENGQSATVSLTGEDASNITISGKVFQDGQFGKIFGTYSSSTGEAGDANLFETNVQVNALTARFSLHSNNNGCQNDGYISGIRHR
jgi:hypothetical protein